MKYCNLNGKIIAFNEAFLPVDNGSFRYGYGLFETMLFQNGAIMLAAYHWERLFGGMKQLYLETPALMTIEGLAQEVLRTVSKNEAEELCRVRLQIFAGGAGVYSDGDANPGFIIECFRLEENILELNENGLVLGLSNGLHKSPDNLSNLKTCNALIYAIAARQATENKWNDALIVNAEGNITESTIANIFWIKNNVVYTPPLAEGCVAGIMRRYVMGKIPVVEKTLSDQELFLADEVFLTNAVKRIKWVRSIEGTEYGNSRIKEICKICFA